MGQALKAVTGAFFTELNNQGGIYNRRVELKFIDTAETPAATRRQRRACVDRRARVRHDGRIHRRRRTRESFALMAQQGVPLIGPLTLYPQTGFPLNRQVFYLLRESTARAAPCSSLPPGGQRIDESRHRRGIPQSEVSAGVLEAIADQCRKRG